MPKKQNPWWLERGLRMLQMNLRETDAGLDPGKFVDQAAAFGAEAVLFNAGGIVANYPTGLPFHYQNPRLKQDLVKTVQEGLRRRGIRFVARFDFSKVHQSIGDRHPAWLYRSRAGKPVLYNGQWHTCLNGAYQQEKMFEILGEALGRYDFDGVFLNFFGYFTWDYSHNYHGICQCAACARRFKQATGQALPRDEDPADPVFRRYQEFCRVTASELSARIGRFIRAQRPGIALVSYDYGGADVKCTESNSDVDRALPEWNYSASDNVKRSQGSFRDMPACNAAISFAGHPCRHVGVSPHLTALRLAGDLIHGGWLWYVVIGPLWQQADRSSLEPARELFRFHQAQAAWLGRTVSKAKLALVSTGGASYRGLFRMLSENHVPFDVIEGFRLAADLPRPLAAYQALVVPDVANLDASARQALDAYVKAGGRLLASGLGGEKLACLRLGPLKKVHPKKMGRYLSLRPEDKKCLKQESLRHLDLLYLDQALEEYKPGKGVRSLLRLIPETMFGPPEKCYLGPVSQIPACFSSSHGKGRSAYFPWALGAHHDPRSFSGHAGLFMGALEGLLGFRSGLEVQAHPLLEVSHRADTEGRFEWLGLINHSGQNGSAFHAPLPLRDIQIRLKTSLSKPRTVRLLRKEQKLKFKFDKGWLECRVPEMDLLEVLLIEGGS